MVSLKKLSLKIPQIKRLWDDRISLIQERDRLKDEIRIIKASFDSNNIKVTLINNNNDEFPINSIFKDEILNHEGLECFIRKTDETGVIGSSEVNTYWDGKFYNPATRPDENLDPYSDEYVNQQVALYKEISGREVNQDKNEHTSFDIDAHINAINPYLHQLPSSLSVHFLRLSRAMRIANIPTGSRLLDMGCGWGLSTEFFRYLGLEVTGLDINPDFVNLVNSRAKRLNTNIVAFQGSFESIPGDDVYNAVVYYECLHHAIRPWETLSLVFKRLSPGGKLIFCGEPVNQIWKSWGLRLDPLSIYCIKKFGWFESGWSPEFISDCVQKCGFLIDHFADDGGDIGWVMVANRP